MHPERRRPAPSRSGWPPRALWLRALQRPSLLDRSVRIPAGPTCQHRRLQALPRSRSRSPELHPLLARSPGTVREPAAEPEERTLPRASAAPPARLGAARLGSRSPPRPWPEPARRRRRRRSCRCSLRCCCCRCCCPPAATRSKVSGVGGRVRGFRCSAHPGVGRREPAVWCRYGPSARRRRAPPPAPAPVAGGEGGEDAHRDAWEAPAGSEAGGSTGGTVAGRWTRVERLRESWPRRALLCEYPAEKRGLGSSGRRASVGDPREAEAPRLRQSCGKRDSPGGGAALVRNPLEFIVGV